MTEFDVLCSLCTQIFEAEESGSLNNWTDGHTWESFTKALDESCYICLQTWNKINKSVNGAQGHWDRIPAPEWKMLHRYKYIKQRGVINVRCILGAVLTTIPFEVLDPQEGAAYRFLRPEIGNDTSSELSLGQAYQWYSACQSKHQKCIRLRRPQASLPSRLIDVGSKDDLQWKLCTTTDGFIALRDYVTLSYCWGSKKPIELRLANLEEFCRGKPISELPETFRDAIVVARRLGVRYLWIDALCIVQDHAPDWEIESLKMRDVYANSACNICAANSTDALGGLFRTRRPTDVRPALVKIEITNSQGAKETKQRIVYFGRYWEDQISNSNLHHRGWVFQERMLAPRVLHFAERQIFWECFEEQKCEGFPMPHSSSTHFKNLDPLFGELYDHAPWINHNALWYELVKTYSKCSFSYDTDRLIALSGLARIFEEKTSDIYMAGLWKSDLPQSLTWYHQYPAAKKPLEYVAPTWSWASTNAPISFLNDWGFKKFAEILKAEVVPSMANPTSNTGKVRSGFLVIRGLVQQVTCLHTTDKDQLTRFQLESLACNLYMFPDTRGAIASPGSAYLFLALSYRESLVKGVRGEPKLIGLALRHHFEKPEWFERVGAFQIQEKGAIESFGLSLTEGKDSKWIVKVDEGKLSTVTII